MTTNLLEKEYDMLVSELRQNRMIQLQTFLSTPIWVSIFLGLLGSNQDNIWEQSELFLVPIPLIYIGLLLILDRRKSSDIIIAYFRTAIDQAMASKPGWNHLLPEFRKEFLRIYSVGEKKKKIPQRVDFNVLVWLSYLTVSLICIALFAKGASATTANIASVSLLTCIAYIAMLIRMIVQSQKKGAYIEAWATVLKNRA